MKNTRKYDGEIMTILYFILAGIAGGILAGMGMGGGTLTLPILVLLLGVNQLTAQYANLIAFIPSGSVALFLHTKNGLIKLKNAIFILLPAIVFCVLASIFAVRIDANLLKKLFGGFLSAIAIGSLSMKILKKH